MPRSAGRSRRRRSAGRSGPARPRPAPGPPWTATGSSSGQSTPRWTPSRWPRARCGSAATARTATRSSSARAPPPWGCTTCSRTAGGASGLPTGCAASGWTAVRRFLPRGRPSGVTEPAGRRTRKDRDPARRVALDVLLAVTGRDAYANLLLPQLLRRRGLAGRDAALATELAYGTLRGRGTYDAVLAICCDRDLDSLDAVVREVLRLGTHQLLATRIQPHAAVATSVNLVKDAAGQRPAGFVNAVLRRVATRDLTGWLDIAAPKREADPVGYLAVRYSYPGWIVEAFAATLGEVPGVDMPQTEAALAAGSERPSVHLCVVPGLADREELVAAGCAPARWSPFGAYLADGDPAAISAVAEGRAGVQDEASQLAAVALARVGLDGGDACWLDMCAGPGGKARLLGGLASEAHEGEAHEGEMAATGAQATEAGVRLVAAEVRENRARL